uniref:Ubiquitin carboxyl-terminal hydrolase n=1 Tax=Blastobotrys adeninivorans TaxID=409370 RepID=A0A060SYE5_BLAAD
MIRSRYAYAVGLALLVYVFYPTLEELNPFPLLMFRRRKKAGRYTVGLTNRANDCFANSNLQALASLPELYAYLASVADADASTDTRLTIAMRDMIKALNEPILDPKCLSPWNLLRVLEQIYKSRISRAQHDAHELLHLVLETLENERNRAARLSSDQEKESSLPSQAKHVPPFPFSGATVDRIICSRCGYSPPAPPSPFLVLSLMVPQKRSTSLTEMLDNLGAPEHIQDYGCTACRLQYALKNPNTPADVVNKLKFYANDPASLPTELEELLPKEITSPIAKSTTFQSLPRVFTVHLSRSIYGGYGASRNSCKVAVPETLELQNEVAPSSKSNSDPSQPPSILGRRKVKYRLAALIRHRGTHQTGHYECFRRKELVKWDDILNEPEVSMQSRDLGFKLNNRLLYPVNGAQSAPVPGSPASQVSELSEVVPGTPLPEPMYRSNDSTASQLPYPSRPSPHVSLDPVHTTSDKASSKGANGNGNSNGTTTPTSLSNRSDVAPANPQYPWWKISDERVWECSTKEALKDESGAYLLFYETVHDDDNNIDQLRETLSSL